MALDSLTGYFKVEFQFSGSKSLTGTDYSAITNNTTISKKLSISSDTANASAGGGDECVSYLLSIAGGGNSTVDLTSLTNVLSQTASFARIKLMMFRLLSTTDDATNGSNCTSVTIGNAAANANQLFLGGDTHTFTLLNGDVLGYGTGSAAGKTVDASNLNVFVLNNDGTNTAKVQISLTGGST